MNTTVRRIGVVLGFAILLGSFALSRYLISSKQPPPQIPSFQTQLKIPVRLVNPTDQMVPLEIQGNLVAFDKIEVYSEVSGVLEYGKIPFKVGSFFPKGSVLAQVNLKEAELALFSQKSTFLNSIIQILPDLKIDYPEAYPAWKNYVDEFSEKTPIKPLPESRSEKEKYFISSKGIYTQFYNIKSADERISKFTILAPFSGMLVQTSIQPGSLVRVGQKLGDFMNNQSYELEVTVPLSELKYLKIGDPVDLFSDDVTGKWTGKVVRISEQVNSTSQTIKVFVKIHGNGLKEGMYLKGIVKTRPVKNAVQLDRNLLINGKEVFVVEDSILVKKEVTPIQFYSDQVIVTGLNEGDWLMTSQIAGAASGVQVVPIPQSNSN